MAFSHGVNEVIAQVLVDSGITNVYNSAIWPTFVGDEPDSPDQVVTVYNTTPVKNGRVMNSGEVLLHWGIQIRVRSLTPKPGFVKLHAICDYLDGLAHKYVSMPDDSEYDIHAMSNQNGVLDLGKEQLTRMNIHVANYLVALTQY